VVTHPGIGNSGRYVHSVRFRSREYALRHTKLHIDFYNTQLKDFKLLAGLIKKLLTFYTPKKLCI